MNKDETTKLVLEAINAALIQAQREFSDFFGTPTFLSIAGMTRCVEAGLKHVNLSEPLKIERASHIHSPDGRDAGAHPDDPYFCKCGRRIFYKDGKWNDAKMGGA